MKKILFFALLFLFLSPLFIKSSVYALKLDVDITPYNSQGQPITTPHLDTKKIDITFTNTDPTHPFDPSLTKGDFVYGIELSAKDTTNPAWCVIATSDNVVIVGTNLNIGKFTSVSADKITVTLPIDSSWQTTRCKGVGKKNIRFGIVKNDALEINTQPHLVFKDIFFEREIVVEQVNGGRPDQSPVKTTSYGLNEAPQTYLYNAKEGNSYVFWWHDVGNASVVQGQGEDPKFAFAAIQDGPPNGAINLEKPAGDLSTPPGKKLKLCMDIFLPKSANNSFLLTCRPELSSLFSFSSNPSVSTDCRVEPARPTTGQPVNLLIWNGDVNGLYQSQLIKPGGDPTYPEQIDNQKADGKGTAVLKLGDNLPVGPYTAIGKDSSGSKCRKQFTISTPQPTPAFQIPTLLPTALPPAPICERLVNDKCEAVDTALGSIDVKPEKFIEKIFGILLGLSGGIALLLIIYSGYKLMLAQGNPEAIQGARETLTSAIVGLLFIIFSVVILRVIGVDILHIPGFK